MTWFRVDDSFPTHRKVLAIPKPKRKPVIGLWTLIGGWCAHHLTNGHVPAYMVGEMGGTRSEAAILVSVGLWEEREDGYQFHDWTDWQPTREKVEKDRAAARDRMRKIRNGSGEVRANEQRSSESVRDTRPDPSRPVSVVTSPDQSSKQREVPEDGLLTIALATGGDLAHARKVASHVLGSSGSDVRNPLRYVLAAVRENPEAHRYRRGNPTKDTECPEHPGEWADRCRIHAFDRGTA